MTTKKPSGPAEIVHVALWNELNLTLKDWDSLVDRADKNLAVDPAKLRRLRVKITDLLARMDTCERGMK